MMSEWERELVPTNRKFHGAELASRFRAMTSHKQDQALARLDLLERITLIYWLARTESPDAKWGSISESGRYVRRAA